MNHINFIDELNSIKRLSDRFNIVRDSKKEKAPEIDNLEFCIADYKVLMCTQNTDYMIDGYTPFHIQGTPYLTDKDKLFLEQYRIGKISAPLMAGYYCDVFCNAQEKKNAKYVNEIIENYLHVVSNHNIYFDNDCIWIWKSLIYNSKTYKRYVEDVTNAIEEFLASDIDLFLKYKLLVNAYNFGFLNSTQVFSFATSQSLLYTISDSYRDNESFFKMLLNCTPNKEKETIRMINQRLADNEDYIIKQHPIDKNLAPYLLSKTEYLKNAGLEKEAEECNKLFIQAKCSTEGYNIVNFKLRIPSELLESSKYLIENNSNPLQFLAENDDILPPSIDFVSPISDELDRLGISVKETDINGNPHPNNGQVMKLDYKCYYNILTIYPFKLALKSLISKKIFDEKGLVEYLNTTWLGEPRVPVNSTLNSTQESWIDSIRPSLHLLHLAINNELEGGKSELNEYLCPIDSLTLKIEGCLRDVCRRIGISTVRDKDHNEITLEKVISKISDYQEKRKVVLLSSKSINMLKKLLTKDDSGGSNMRNNIAHGFTSTRLYTMETALTVIHCILRISSIKFPSV